ncbi:MAG: DMT family transporter [Pikeienuella sp.]
MAVHPTPGREDKAMLGIALVIAAYFAFSFIDLFSKYLALAGIPAMQLVFMRYAGHLVLSGIVLFHHGDGLAELKTPKTGIVILRGLLLLGSTVLNFWALRYLPLTLTTTFIFLAPIIVCALSWPILGERVGPFRWTAIMVGFTGIIIAIRPFDAEFHWATLMSFGSVICFASYNVVTRHLAGVVNSSAMQFYAGMTGTVVMAPFAFAVWTQPEQQVFWLMMIGMSFCGWLGHELLTRSYRFAEANKLIPFGYSLIIYMTLWSWLVFDHLPELPTIIGGSIIVGSGLVIWAREAHLARIGRREAAKQVEGFKG